MDTRSVLCLAVFLLGSISHGSGVNVPDAQRKRLPFPDGAIVSVDELQAIADRNARALWGDVRSAPPQPYLGVDGKPLACRFTYALGAAFPDASSIKADCARRATGGDFPGQWGDGRYVSILMGARRDLPPFLERMLGLSPEYALGIELERLATARLGPGAVPGKAWLLGFNDLWYEFGKGEQRVFVKAQPPAQVLEAQRFDELLRTQDSFFLAPDDHDAEWEGYASGELLLTRNDTTIPWLGRMPFVQWTYGCSPCSASMLFAWYDNIGMEVSSEWALLVRHYIQHWDPVQEHVDYHSPDSAGDLADAMGTDSSGGTDIWDIDDGMVTVAQDRGYGAVSETLYFHDYDWFWDYLRNWIGDGWPLLTGISGHTMVGVGYNTDNREYINHDPNSGVLNYRNRSSLYSLHPINMLDAWDLSAVQLVVPHGDTAWHENAGDGEIYAPGGVCGIVWDGDFDAGTSARLSYSLEGGIDGYWEEIVASTPNDGVYNWTIPTGLHSIACRVRVEILDSGGEVVGSDGSWGNFIIEPGAATPTLWDDISRACDHDPGFYWFDHETAGWYAVGVRTADLIDHWDIEVHEDTTFSSTLVSYSGGFTNNYVVVDGFNLPQQTRGVRVDGHQAGNAARVEFEGQAEVLPVDSLLLTYWPTNDVVETWNVFLEPGEYTFLLERLPTGVVDLDMALFHFDDWPWAGGRTDHYQNAFSRQVGSLVPESFSCTVDQADWFGLCVSSRNTGYGDYSLLVARGGSWSGDVSSDWFDPQNWFNGAVPDEVSEVQIPGGRPHDPVVDGVGAVCASLAVRPGATLVLRDDLVVGNHLDLTGNLVLESAGVELTIGGHLRCHDGTGLMATDGTRIRVSGTLLIENGAWVDLQAGALRFEGYESSELQVHDGRTVFHDLENAKSDFGALHFSALSTTGFHIGGDLVLLENSMLEGGSSRAVTLNGSLVKETGAWFSFWDGELVFENSTSELESDETDSFNDLRLVNSTLSLQGDLWVNGNLRTESGLLALGPHQLYLSGDWTNNAGAGVLGGSTGGVHFVSWMEQALSGDTDLPDLHLENTGDGLRCPGGAIHCTSWNWVSGALHVDGAVFTAADIASPTLEGVYVLDAGELNLHQDAAHWVDLNAEITIHDGAFNVHGGYLIDSYWPYTQNASLTMDGGVLDFKDNGIYLHDGQFLLTDAITGGTIRTAGNFSGLRHDFNPGGGKIELYGPADGILGHGVGSSFHEVVIDKGSTLSAAAGGKAPRSGQAATGIAFPKAGRTPDSARDSRDGPSSSSSRSQTVHVNSSLDIDGDLVILGGTLQPEGWSINIDDDLDVRGSLLIGSDDQLRAGDDVILRDGSATIASGGSIHCEGSWIMFAGSTTSLSPDCSVHLDGDGPGEIHSFSTGSGFGRLVVDKFQGGSVQLSTMGTEPIRVAGSLEILPGNALQVQNQRLLLESLFDLPPGATLSTGAGGEVTGADLLIAGSLELGQGSLTAHGNFVLEPGGVMELSGGQVLCDRSYTGNFISLAGALQFDSGLFQVVNDGLQFGGPAGSQISGGVFRLGWGLRANQAGGLTPTGGRVEFSGGGYPAIECTTGNHLHDLVVDKSAGMVMAMSDLELRGELHLVSRPLDLMGHALTVEGDLTIEPGAQLDPGGGDVRVGGDWGNYGGPAAFAEAGSRVTFIGESEAWILVDDTFHDLSIEKDPYAGAPIHLPLGRQLQVLGDFHATSGPMWLHGESGLRIAGSLAIWNEADLVAGLEVPDAEIDVGGDWNNWSGDDVTGFQPGSSTVTFNGAGDQIVDAWSCAAFHHLTVNKPGGMLVAGCTRVGGDCSFLDGDWGASQPGDTLWLAGDLLVAPEAIWTGIPVLAFFGPEDQDLDLQGGQPLGSVLVAKGSAPARDVPAGRVLLGSDVLLESGGLRIQAGALNASGHSLTGTGGNVEVEADGELRFGPGGELRLGDGRALTVAGRLELLGDTQSSALLTHADTSAYSCAILDGGVLAAEYAIFEHMDWAGVHVWPLGAIDSVHALRHCTFRDGAEWGTLLTLDQDQADLSIEGAHFPANDWQGMYNVTRASYAFPMWPVTFVGATGDFAGPDFENDPYDGVDWVAGGSPNLHVSAIQWSATELFPGQEAVLRFQIDNDGAAASGEFQLGFYRDRPVPPVPADAPNLVLPLAGLAAGASLIDSLVLSHDGSGTWASWLLADCGQQVVETDEGDNAGGPAAMVWLPLPPVSDLEITYDTLPGDVVLGWSHPLATGFHVYRGSNPNFAPSPGTLIAVLESPTMEYCDPAIGPCFFYKVGALVELPARTAALQANGPGGDGGKE